eukprot:6663907-Pyramimonas_sp.AAC.1
MTADRVPSERTASGCEFARKSNCLGGGEARAAMAPVEMMGAEMRNARKPRVKEPRQGPSPKRGT